MKTELAELFRDRVSEEPLRMAAYAHDMGVLPDVIKRSIRSLPDAVVQPVDSEEVAALVGLAAEARVPLVPRGAASAGFGGAVPAAGGIVVDTVRMNSVVDIDVENMTVTAQAGAVWADVQSVLNEQGLDLRIYPTSALSATVGGWVAQGGGGIGSAGCGTVRDNLVAVEVVLGTGDIVLLTGDDLDLVYGVGGTTGVITSATFAVKSLEPHAKGLAAFGSAAELNEFLRRVRALEPWHVGVQSPPFVDLKNRVQETDLPTLYLGFVVAKDTTGFADEFAQIVEDTGGRVLDAHAAEHEWEERFYPLRGKKLGPSIIAADVVVPVDGFAEFARRVESKFKGDVVFEATMLGADRLAVVAFQLADERRVTFPVLYANSLVVADIARKVGGRVYGAGKYFTDDARDVLGADAFDRVVDYKRRTDPGFMFNPGTALPRSVEKGSPTANLARAIKAAGMGKGVISGLGRLVGGKSADSRVSGNGGRTIGDLPEHMEEEAFACASCGFCRGTCTVFDADPWEDNSPRGKWYLLKEYVKGNLDLDTQMATALNLCTTCKKCDTVCEVGLENAHNYLALKPFLNKKGYVNTGLDAIKQNVMSTGNFWGAGSEATQWLTSDIRVADEGPTAYWPGCWASIIMKNMPQNLARIANAAGEELVYVGQEQVCCGLYHALGGYEEALLGQIENNIELLHSRGVETLITSCPGCFATFNENYPHAAEHLGLSWDIDVKHATVYMAELVREGRLDFTGLEPTTVTYHDSCHVGRWFDIYDEPREVLEAVPGVSLVEMEHNREKSLCCGLVASFYDLGTVGHSGTKRVSEAVSTGAEYLVTNCAGCGSQFNFTTHAMGVDVRQTDLTDIVARGLGFEEVFDPTESVKAHMEGAIELLSTSCTQLRAEEASEGVA